jgi:hypothetical protein
MKTKGSVIPIPENKILSQFEEITLEEMEQVKLLNRFDSKYCMQTAQLQTILEEILSGYFILKIDNTIVQTYNSVYFDTPGNQFYLAHHNGKAGRFKIRKRSYINSALSFTEIKLKSNKGITSKKRIRNFSDSNHISAAEKHFIADTLNFDSDNLEVKSTNIFNRITLVSKHFNERCTIDLNITFVNSGNSLRLNDFVVVEIKQGILNMQSKLADSLKKNRIYPEGFSKYTMGRALTEEKLKKNLFKAKILKIRKQCNMILEQNTPIPEYCFSY